MEVSPTQQPLHLATANNFDAASFIGPGLSAVDRYAISNCIHTIWNDTLHEKSTFGYEYAYSVQQGNMEIYGQDEREVGPVDEPGK